MKPYTTEVEFLRDEVEKCHASMHSQIETISLLMKKNIALKEQNRKWVGLTEEDKAEILSRKWWNFEDEFDLAGFLGLAESILREKNSG
jgi:hypothetical protein